MLALLSSFLTPSPVDPDDRVRQLLDYDVAGFGLSHALAEPEFRAFVAASRTMKQTFVMLRANIVVLERELEDPARAPKYPSLSSGDSEERRSAIERMRSHLQYAQELECPTLLIDPGRVDVKWPRDEWHEAFDAGKWRHGGRWVDDAAEHRAQLFNKRRRKASPRALDALLSSIDALLDEAQQRGVELVLQNARRGDSLGQPEELKRVFTEFRGAPVSAWFDVGDYDYQEQLGLVDGIRLRRAVRDRLAGITITDADKLNDGVPPGEGMILLPIALNTLYDRDRTPDENPPLIIRCARGTEPDRISESIERLRRDGFDGPPPIEVDPFPIIGG